MEISDDLKKKWKLALDKVETFAHRIEGEEILEAASRYLTANDPTNQRALDLLSAQCKFVRRDTKPKKKSRQPSSRKQTTHR